MRFAILLLTLAATFAIPDVASADSGTAAPSAATPAAPARSYPRTRRWGRGWFSGSSQNWYRSRGTPADNSTIPTPINRHPKGHDPVLFPKSI